MDIIKKDTQYTKIISAVGRVFMGVKLAIGWVAKIGIAYHINRESKFDSIGYIKRK